ncbi:MAG: hypothetical protein WBC45_07010, partial [Atribacterota bacterium]
MFLLPVIPFITDRPELMEETIRKASEAGLDFIIFGGMTLKEGRQKDIFYKILRNNYPQLTGEYENIYQKNKWGEAAGEYYNSINQTFSSIIKKYKIPPRIPLALYKDILEENDLVVVILEHIDYLLKLKGRTSPYGYAAYSISRLNEPLSSMKRESKRINGVGKITENIILEILNTRNSSYYKKLLTE